MTSSRQDHIQRMQNVTRANGWQFSDQVLEQAWFNYSDSVYAGWLRLPDSDYTLSNILLDTLGYNETYQEYLPLFHEFIDDMFIHDHAVHQSLALITTNYQLSRGEELTFMEFVCKYIIDMSVDS